MRGNPNILVVNAGSSSVKFAVYGVDLVLRLNGQLQGIGTKPRLTVVDADCAALVDTWLEPQDANAHTLLATMTDWLERHLGNDRLAAIGHRVALGGLSHSGPAVVTPQLIAQLQSLTPLAPLHLPRNIEPIVSLGRLHPNLPQVACFDTAFHQSLPRVARLYGLPRHLLESGAQRYGFHGLSYEYIASQLPGIDRRAAEGRTIIAHLGSGSSLCALKAGKSIATTMGFSPLSGLVMGTRPGELDAGLIIWLIRERGLRLSELEHMLYHDSGLKGVSNLSNDMRDLLASSSPHAREAVDLFVYRILVEMGGLIAALGGLDAVVFTAGIGEHAAAVRQAVCERLEWAGVRLDTAANHAGAQYISARGSQVSLYAIPTNEELMVARHTRALVWERGATSDPKAASKSGIRP